jgi:hypothetical protein
MILARPTKKRTRVAEPDQRTGESEAPKAPRNRFWPAAAEKLPETGQTRQGGL